MNTFSCKSLLVLLTTVVFLLTGCSTTRVTGVWKKSDYVGGPFQNILVVGLTKDESNKSIWEDVMADQLRHSGVDATTSAKCFPGDTDITKTEILEYVKQRGIDAVLVTRLVDTREETAYYPPTGGFYPGYYDGYFYGDPYHRYYNHFGSYYDRVYTPGYTETYTTVVLETNLYDTRTQELVWSMTSDTFDPASANKLALSVSKKVVKVLEKNNLISRTR